MLLLAQLYAERAAKTIVVCEARDLAAVLTVFTTADEDPHRSPQASAPERRLPRAQATIIALSAATMLHGRRLLCRKCAGAAASGGREGERQRQARQAAKAARKQAEEKQAEAQGQAQELEEQGHRQARIADLARSGRTSSAAARKAAARRAQLPAWLRLRGSSPTSPAQPAACPPVMACPPSLWVTSWRPGAPAGPVVRRGAARLANWTSSESSIPGWVGVGRLQAELLAAALDADGPVAAGAGAGRLAAAAETEACSGYHHSFDLLGT